MTGNELPAPRWLMNHMIGEYGRHNGRAGLLRERIDGATAAEAGSSRQGRSRAATNGL